MSSSEKINILTLDVLTNTISLIGKERFSDYFFKNINYHMFFVCKDNKNKLIVLEYFYQIFTTFNKLKIIVTNRQ